MVPRVNSEAEEMKMANFKQPEPLDSTAKMGRVEGKFRNLRMITELEKKTEAIQIAPLKVLHGTGSNKIVIE